MVNNSYSRKHASNVAIMSSNRPAVRPFNPRGPAFHMEGSIFHSSLESL